MKRVQLFHSITHNQVEYSPGVHELDDALADHFLALKGADGELLRVASLYDPKEVMGKTKKAADAPDDEGGTKTPVGPAAQSNVPVDPDLGKKPKEPAKK